MQPQKVIIKKYENRRLYDTAASRYVNLEEVAQMLRDGADVQVVDAATGEDLTRLILTQIIMENAKDRDSAFPLDILRQMVMTSGATSQEALLKYMKSTLEIYQNAYRAFAPAATPLDFMQSMMGAAPPPPSQPQPPPDSPSPNSEVDELRKRIEELEKMFAGSKPGQSAGKKPKSAR
jgi:polyhydroxyalkanoate synthesis repressor PhaR